MYRRFLLFNEFYAASSPVIVCEGKTDNVYILHAIRSLASAYPQLATTDAVGTIKLNVRIYKYSGTSTGQILGITGGSGDLGNFVRHYSAAITRFNAPGQQHPVVLLIDNDSGADGIYNQVKQITKLKPDGKEAFVHVKGNLYLVATPLKPGNQPSAIEDFFDTATKATKINGKTFNVKNDSDSKSTYGKTVFAHKVVKPNANIINFSGFHEILSNVVAVIETHARKHSVVIPMP